MPNFGDLCFIERRSARRFQASLKKMDHLLKQGFQSWTIDRAGKRLLAKLAGGAKGGQGIYDVASNRAARRTASRIIVRELVRMLKANPKLRLRHLTMIGDRFCSTDRHCVFELGALKGVLHRLLAPAKLDGWMGIGEIQPLANWEPGIGRKLYGHKHALIWTADPDFDFKALETRLCNSQQLSCAIGAATVRITGELENFDNMSLGDKLEMARIWTRYPLKMPVHAKNLVPIAGRPGKQRTYKKDVRPDLAVRLFEILSRVSCYELFSASGEGKAILAEIKRALPGAGQRIERAAFDQEVAAFWAYTRRRNGKQQYLPPKITGMKHGQRLAPSIRGPYRKRGRPMTEVAKVT